MENPFDRIPKYKKVYFSEVEEGSSVPSIILRVNALALTFIPTIFEDKKYENFLKEIFSSPYTYERDDLLKEMSIVETIYRRRVEGSFFSYFSEFILAFVKALNSRVEPQLKIEDLKKTVSSDFKKEYTFYALSTLFSENFSLIYSYASSMKPTTRNLVNGYQIISSRRELSEYTKDLNFSEYLSTFFPNSPAAFYMAVNTKKGMISVSSKTSIAYNKKYSEYESKLTQTDYRNEKQRMEAYKVWIQSPVNLTRDSDHVVIEDRKGKIRVPDSSSVMQGLGISNKKIVPGPLFFISWYEISKIFIDQFDTSTDVAYFLVGLIFSVYIGSDLDSAIQKYTPFFASKKTF